MSKLGADLFLQWFEIYSYTQFEMRITLVCRFFFTLKLWPDKVFNRHVPTYDQPPSKNLIVKNNCPDLRI